MFFWKCSDKYVIWKPFKIILQQFVLLILLTQGPKNFQVGLSFSFSISFLFLTEKLAQTPQYFSNFLQNREIRTYHKEIWSALTIFCFTVFFVLTHKIYCFFRIGRLWTESGWGCPAGRPITRAPQTYAWNSVLSFGKSCCKILQKYDDSWKFGRLFRSDPVKRRGRNSCGNYGYQICQCCSRNPGRKLETNSSR